MACYYNNNYNYCPYPYYGGYYNCIPYQTQFKKVEVSPGAVRQGRRQPSTNLMQDADKLSQGMYKGLDNCSTLMKGSEDASLNARELGRSFDEFTTDFCNFADTTTKFLSTITYPDFKLATHPKPTFNEVGVWKSLNDDFTRQLDSFNVLGYYDKGEESPSTDNENQNATLTGNQRMWRWETQCPNDQHPPQQPFKRYRGPPMIQNYGRGGNQ